MQWHPYFAKLLRPLLEDYFDVQINVPVGDAPREADLVLVRRKAPGKLPFHGLWKHLTSWNVLEYKGPTASARFGDLDLLVELGLGIHRRLREKQNASLMRAAHEVSFWYLTHHLGKRFLRQAARTLGSLDTLGPGIWRCTLLGRLIFLVNGEELPVETDSLPFHILEPETTEREQAIARVLIDQPNLLPTLGNWVLSLHPALLREITKMARTKQLNPKIKPLVEFLGIDEVAKQLSDDKEIPDADKENLARRLLASLAPARRRAFRKSLREENCD